MKKAKLSEKLTKGKRWQLLCLPLLAALAVVAVLSLLRSADEETHVTVEEKTYQFSMGQKTEYEPGMTLLPGKYAIIFEQEEQQSDGDATPLYSADAPAMYLTRDVSWVQPDTGYEWSIPAFSRLELDDRGSVWCSIGDKKIGLGGGVLNDCAGTYVFLDSVMLFINGRMLELAPFSFCSTVGSQIRIYNYGSGDDLYTADYRTADLVIRSRSGYTVNLTTGIYTGLDGGYRLLTASPQLLPKLEERE